MLRKITENPINSGILMLPSDSSVAVHCNTFNLQIRVDQLHNVNAGCSHPCLLAASLGNIGVAVGGE
jgi:hypothetical protein